MKSPESELCGSSGRTREPSKGAVSSEVGGQASRGGAGRERQVVIRPSAQHRRPRVGKVMEVTIGQRVPHRGWVCLHQLLVVGMVWVEKNASLCTIELMRQC